MGSSFNKAIFEDYIQEHLIEWAHKAKKTRTSLHHLLPSPPRDAAVTKRTLSMPAIRISTVEEGHNSTAREIKSEHHIHTEKENVVETQLTCEGVTKSAEKPVL